MTIGEPLPQCQTPQGSEDTVKTLIQAVWIFWVFKQKGFSLKQLHSVSFLFSLLRKNWTKLKRLMKTSQRESRKWLKEVSGGWRSGRRGSEVGRDQAGCALGSFSLNVP